MTLWKDKKLDNYGVQEVWWEPPYPTGYRKVWEVFDDEDKIEWIAQGLSLEEALWYLALLECEEIASTTGEGFRKKLIEKMELYCVYPERKIQWVLSKFNTKNLTQNYRPLTKRGSHGRPFSPYRVGTWKAEKLLAKSLEWENKNRTKFPSRTEEE